VQDRSGRPIEGLTRADFTVLEDGKEQTIELFNVETSRPGIRAADATVAVSPAAAESAPLSSRVYTNRLAAKPGGVTVIVFDRLNTAWEDQARARDQIVKTLGEFQPEDRIALYVLESDSLRILHDFTGDTASLRATLARFRTSSSRERQASLDTPLPDASTGNTKLDAELANWLETTMREVSSIYIRNRSEYTMDAFQGVARRLAGIRGRKNLVWVSSAFPLLYQDRFGPQTSDLFLDRASRAVNDADIAVYAIDPLGQVAPAMTASGRNVATLPTQEVDRAHRTAADDARVTGLLSGVTATQATTETREYLSGATGGRAIHGNDIGKAIRSAVADSRMSYVLGYYPKKATWDGLYRPIKVTVNRPGAVVRSRKGYFATRTAAADPAMSTEELLATMRNPFEATGIDLNATVERVTGGDSAAKQVRVELRFDAPNLTLAKKGEDWEGALDIAIAQSTASGQTFKTFSAKADLRFTAEQRASLLRDGFRFDRVFAIRPDSIRVQVVVRDVPSGAIGSVIIPTAGWR
jgi:VWFA-related protein